jgi:hypothetical protein
MTESTLTSTPTATAASTHLRFVTNSVLQWHDVLLDTLLADSQEPPSLRNQNGPTRASRAAAIVHAAIFNAVVGIRGGYQPYAIRIPTVPASPVLRQAVAGAAYGTLVRLYPRQAPALRAVAERYFSVSSPSPSASYGLLIAQRQIANRSNDGSGGMGVYAEPALPGVWRPDPLDPAQQALDPHWGSVRPFALEAADLNAIVDALPRPPGYRGPGRPYNLENSAYRAALAEVRAVGSVQASPENDTRTLNAIFWSYDEGRGTPIRLYNQAARAVALRGPRMGLLGWARLFFLANLAMADAGIATWSAKYRYDLWRPVHGVRLDPVDPDRRWTPLGKQLPYAQVQHCSPPFPAYVSGHAAFGEALFHTLRRFYATDTFTFVLASDELPREARRYTTFTGASRANARSRVELGVHFTFDGTRGRTLGLQVSDQAYSRLNRLQLFNASEIEIADVNAPAEDETAGT